MFQAALGGAVLFNPERQADPLAVAAGAGTVALGAASAIGLRELIGSGNAGSAATTLVAAAGSVLAAALASGFARKQLGPDRTNEDPRALVAVARGLVDGMRAV